MGPPGYRWTCHVCEHGNPPGRPSCTRCGFPADAEGRHIDLARRHRAAGRSLSPDFFADPRGALRRAIDFVLASEIRIAFAVLVMASFVVVGTSWGRYSSPEFIDGIRVEAHGTLFDILVIGLFILWLNFKRAESERVRRYAEEIDDFREWRSDEASHRIAG